MDSDQHFCLIPIQFTLSKPDSSILALTQYQNSLVVSVNEARLFTLNIQFESNGSIKAESKAQHIKNKPDYEIVQLGNLDNLLFILFKKHNSTRGILFSKCDDSMTKVSENVICFAANCPDSQNPHSQKLVAAIINLQIHIFAYSELISKSEWKDKFSYDKINPVLSISLSNQFLFVLTPKMAYYINTETNGPGPCCNSFRLDSDDHSFCMPYIDRKYFVYSNKISHIIEPESNFQDKQINLSFPHFEHSRIESNFASTFQSGISVYEIEKKTVSTIHLPDCQHITKFTDSNRSVFIAASRQNLYAVFECTTAFNRIVDGQLEEAYASIGSNKHLVWGVFEQLWQCGFKQQALTMLKFVEMREIIYEVVSLFTIVKLDTKQSSGRHLTICEKTDDQRLARCFADKLLSIRGSSDNSAKRIIDTSLFEIYSYQEDVSSLSSFIRQQPILIDSALNEFFGEVQSPARALYLAYAGDHKMALSIFAKLDNYSEAVIDQTKRILVGTAADDDWSDFKENLKWLFSVSPIAAVDVLTNDAVDSNRSLELCKDEFPDIYILVLKGVIGRKSLKCRKDLINNYAKHIFQLLFRINSDDKNFPQKEVNFCRCVIENTSGKPTPIDKIKEELSNDFIDALKNFPNEIDIKDPIFSSNEISSLPKVQIEIFRASGAVEKALLLLWEENLPDFQKSGTIEVLENFCRESKDSSAAFLTLIKIMKEKLPDKNEIEILTKVLSRNMSVIDVAEALKNISDDEPLSEALMSFLEKTYITLIQMRKDAQIEQSISESEDFESSYQKIRLESQVIEVINGVKCAKCGNPLSGMYILRAPNGELYHWKCLDAKS